MEITDLVKQFAKQAGCSRYANDSDKLALLIDYVWLWQLTPALPFETFLEKYAAVADHDDNNLKHPDTAMRALCPRTQASSAKLNRPQWTAAQLADFIMLYVDMIRAADAEKVPVPLPFSTFLKNLGPQYLAGTFPPKPTPLFDNLPAPAQPTSPAPAQAVPAQSPPVAATTPPSATPQVAAPPAAATPAAAPRQRPRKAAAAAAPAAATAPTGIVAGQQAIYTNQQGRQRVGTIEAVEACSITNKQYVNFVDIGGERFEGLAIESVRPATPADGPFPAPVAGPRVASVRLTIPRAHYPSVASVLKLEQPCGTVPVGDVIYPFEAAFDQAVGGVIAHLDVVNGETGPYVDAYLVDAHGTAIADIPPRENIVGTYTFKTEKGVFEMMVASRGVEEVPAPPAAVVAAPPQQAVA